jgi:hypothetical protein
MKVAIRIWDDQRVEHYRKRLEEARRARNKDDGGRTARSY